MMGGVLSFRTVACRRASDLACSWAVLQLRLGKGGHMQSSLGGITTSVGYQPHRSRNRLLDGRP